MNLRILYSKINISYLLSDSIRAALEIILNKTFILYTLIGSVAVTADYVSFLLLYLLTHNINVNIVSYVVGTITSFILNSIFNFKTPLRIDGYLKFLSISLIGSFWSTKLIAFISLHAAITPLLAKSVIMPLILLYQYICSSRFVYQLPPRRV